MQIEQKSFVLEKGDVSTQAFLPTSETKYRIEFGISNDCWRNLENKGKGTLFLICSFRFLRQKMKKWRKEQYLQVTLCPFLYTFSLNNWFLTVKSPNLVCRWLMIHVGGGSSCTTGALPLCYPLKASAWMGTWFSVGWSEEARCYGLNCVLPSPNSYAEALIPKVIAFGDGTLGM